MEIRPAKPTDLDGIADIDGTIESTHYIHVERSGEGIARSWRLEERTLRQKLIESNPLGDERLFVLKQIVSGADDGIALLAEHESAPMALMLARPDDATQSLRLLDLRVDYDARREGLATVLAYQAISIARDRELRAVIAETRTNNRPANALLLKCGFDLAGIDTHRHSNHDLVKEAVTLIWYAALD
jgi:ribosomal protein S18 acetylase RimI-like enzyme